MSQAIDSLRDFALESRIKALVIAGVPFKKICQDLQVNWTLVSNIVRQHRMVDAVNRARRTLHGVLPDAVKNVRRAVTEEKDVKVSMEVIKGLGVLDAPEQSQGHSTTIVISNIPPHPNEKAVEVPHVVDSHADDPH